MRSDPVTEGRRWLEQAVHDLTWADDLAQRGGYHIACFLAQQVAEKAIKAFLYATGEEIVVGHSVQRLASDAADSDPGFVESSSRWSSLDAYYNPDPVPERTP